MRRVLAGLLALACIASAEAQGLKPWQGGQTPQLEAVDLDGASHDLAQYRGKVVLVNFWATWCAPCRAEMPSIERLRRSLEGRPFAVLAVNVGESGRAAREFAAQVPVGFPLLLDRDTRIAKSWGAKLLPATFIVGPDGAIRYSHLGELDWSRDEVRAAVQKLMRK
jgi:peroxiredoxin